MERWVITNVKDVIQSSRKLIISCVVSAAGGAVLSGIVILANFTPLTDRVSALESEMDRIGNIETKVDLIIEFFNIL